MHDWWAPLTSSLSSEELCISHSVFSAVCLRVLTDDGIRVFVPPWSWVSAWPNVQTRCTSGLANIWVNIDRLSPSCFGSEWWSRADSYLCWNSPVLCYFPVLFAPLEPYQGLNCRGSAISSETYGSWRDLAGTFLPFKTPTAEQSLVTRLTLEIVNFQGRILSSLYQ